MSYKKNCVKDTLGDAKCVCCDSDDTNPHIIICGSCWNAAGIKKLATKLKENSLLGCNEMKSEELGKKGFLFCSECFDLLGVFGYCEECFNKITHV